MRLNPGERGVFPTHPDHYRPPEATLGCGWDHSGDIWMLGVLTWDFIERTNLFKQYESKGRYCARHHLAKMIALLGPPPQELIERSDKMIEKEWPVTVRREEGPLMHNALQMFNGPFFQGHACLASGGEEIGEGVDETSISRFPKINPCTLLYTYKLQSSL